MNANRRSAGVFAGVVLAMFGLSGVAFGDPYVTNFNFTGAAFGSPAWTLNGNAFWANDGALSPSTRLRTTANNLGENGSAWLNTQIMPSANWAISVTGQFSMANGSGADGMALIFQTYGLNSDPLVGDFDPTNMPTAQLGADYLIINLDSYQNTGEPANGLEFFTKLGNTDQDLGTSLEGAEGQGFTFNLNASYDVGLQTLQYTYQRSGYSDVTVVRTNFDMALRFPSNNTAYVGFHGGTGASAENHDVLGMTINAAVIPEPGTITLLAGAGLLAMVARRLRRRP